MLIELLGSRNRALLRADCLGLMHILKSLLQFLELCSCGVSLSIPATNPGAAGVASDDLANICAVLSLHGIYRVRSNLGYRFNPFVQGLCLPWSNQGLPQCLFNRLFVEAGP
ncbi:hypothetical protein IPC780_29140 [Pseudomonas aeruginosa]|nr:hypothetical protein IPC780_29140 [Pseudomonas aeruginosa]